MQLKIINIDNMYKDWEINNNIKLNQYINSIIYNFEYDPLECKKCRHTMELEYGYYIKKKGGNIIYEKWKFFKEVKDPKQPSKIEQDTILDIIKDGIIPYICKECGYEEMYDLKDLLQNPEEYAAMTCPECDGTTIIKK